MVLEKILENPLDSKEFKPILKEINPEYSVYVQDAFYSVHEVLMASILGWFAIYSSSGSHFVRTLL